jgi:transposase
VAKLFQKKASPKHKFVVHVNHNKLDNRASNLKWATQEEVAKHQQKSPAKIAYKAVQASRTQGLKLNAGQVKSIKKILDDPKRKQTYRQLADKYGVSEMTLYRIRSGENWGRI